VNRHALVPRPETELLAELGWEFLQGRAGSPQPAAARSENAPYQDLCALDFGTGTGCIAITLAAKCPSAKIVATDISADALALAKQNAGQHNAAERIEFVQGDGFAALHNESEGGAPRRPDSPKEEWGSRSSPLRKMEFDLIISNPPYIPSAEIATLQPEVRDFDPRGALDGGADGLDFYRKLAAEAKPFLKPGGKIMLEFGDGQADAIRKIFETEKWIVEAVREDYSHRPRILAARF
jgi:release factor glutamine methyltransferase